MNQGLIQDAKWAQENQPLKSKLSVDRNQKFLATPPLKLKIMAAGEGFRRECFGCKFVATSLQVIVSWSQCSITPQKCVCIAAKNNTYHSHKTRPNRGFAALLCSNSAKMCTYHSICCHDRVAIDAWRRNFGGVMLHAHVCDQKIFLRKRDKLHLCAIKETSACCDGVN